MVEKQLRKLFYNEQRCVGLGKFYLGGRLFEQRNPNLNITA